jgi:hypothetical protein
MSAGKYNFIVEQGSQHDVSFRYKTSDGNGLDLTGYRVRMAVKDHITDTTFVYRASTSASSDANHLEHFTIGSNQNQAAEAGKFALSIPASTTTAFSFNQGVYDLELVAPAGTVTRILEGKFKIKLQVSE